MAAALWGLRHFGEERSIYFDVNSGRERYKVTVCYIPIKNEIRETDLSRMLAEEGLIPDNPPRWVLCSSFDNGFFRSHSPHYINHGIRSRASDIPLMIQLCNEFYQRHGDPSLLIESETKKRMLQFFMEQFQNYPETKWRGDWQMQGSHDDWRAFIARFRDPPPSE